MKQYEYKVEVTFAPLIESELNKYGAKGWILVSTFRDSGFLYAVFMREKEQ